MEYKYVKIEPDQLEKIVDGLASISNTIAILCLVVLLRGCLTAISG